MTDHARLSALTYAAAAKKPDAARQLFEKLARACVMLDERTPQDAARLGSVVTYDVGKGFSRTMTLVHPDHIPSGNTISVSAPVGLALLDLRPGQRCDWISQDAEKASYGRSRRRKSDDRRHILKP